MNKTKIIFILMAFIAAGSLFTFCSSEKKQGTVLHLSYTINFKGDSITNKLDGLKWALSYLGAELKDSSFYRNCIPQKDNSIRVCFDSIGFSERALTVLKELTDSLKKSKEYQTKQSIDIGEFIALTIGTSKHYYAITNVFPTYGEFKAKYFTGNEKQFAVVASSVTHNNRKLLLHTDTMALKSAFVAEEGTGSLDSNTFKTELFEVFDVMSNGQLRFAVYNKEGELVDGSPSESGQAGKPAKCIWCHELFIQPLFKKTPDVSGYVSEQEFTAIVKSQMEIINAYRKQLKGAVDFSKTQEHTQMELLYISYMEPSIKKLSQEWGIKEQELSVILKYNQVHSFTEFPFLGELYHRSDLKKYTPFDINIPQSIRETSTNEPLFIKSIKTAGR